MTPKHDTQHDDSTISAFTDLIQKLSMPSNTHIRHAN